MRHDEKSKEQEFDFVVVGAGASAMGLLYGLLSRFKTEPPPFSIAVLERGEGPPHAAATQSPSQWCDASHHESGSVTLIGSHIGSRVIDMPTGRGLGGTTNINACLFTAPAREDFASWPAPWKESMLASVHSVQDEMIANGSLYFHSVETRYDSHTSQDSSVKNSTKSLRETVFPSLVTDVPLSIAERDDGTLVRKNYYESLVAPLLQAHPHLADSVTFVCDFEVQRLLFSRDDQQVIGVEGPHAIYARREVILCAGTIESPALLLVSGIGHCADLIEAGIRPRRKESCAGVGRRLFDHVLVPRVLLTPWSPRTLSPNGVHALCYASSGDNRFQIFMNDAALYPQLVPHFVASYVRRRFSQQTVIGSIGNAIANAFFVSLRAFLRLLVGYSPLYFVMRRFVITMNIALLNPKSRGTVRIRQRDPSGQGKPLRRKDVDLEVDAGYLSHPDDTLALLEGWKTSTDIFETFLCRSLQVFPPGFLLGGRRRNELNEHWFAPFAFQFCLPYFHWCGTCAMETNDNEEWVVDSALKVRDVRGIRVCDASVFPCPISGPTALTCAGLGYSMASMLLSESNKKDK